MIVALNRCQDGSHCHSGYVDPAGAHVLVSDLGQDKIYSYAIDGAAGIVATHQVYEAPPGSGPRHMAFHPNGKWVYVLCELDGNVVVCDWDSAAGTLVPRQSIYALPDGVGCSRAHHSGCSCVYTHAQLFEWAGAVE